MRGIAFEDCWWQPDSIDPLPDSSAVVFDFRGSIDVCFHDVFAHTPWDQVDIAADSPTDAFTVRLSVPAHDIGGAMRSALALIKHARWCTAKVLLHRDGDRAA